MNIKQVALFLFFIICMTLMLGACSEKEFSAAPGSVYNQCVDVRPEVKCIETCDDSGHCVKDVEYTIESRLQPKDVLFVNDVSGSMYREQLRMGSMFPNFLNILQNSNYRVAITTTDLGHANNPPHPKNGNGAFQDGKLVPFPNGRYFLDGRDSQQSEQRQFEEAIEWEQTNLCEQNGYDFQQDSNGRYRRDSNGNLIPVAPSEEQCPSGDERGIFTSYLTFEKNYENFLRPTGQLAVIVLSDEDGWGDTQKGESRVIDPRREDPASYVQGFNALYPHKRLSFHSIVVRPGDQSCFNQQDEGEDPPGRFGRAYALLTEETGGILGDICASQGNYASQLRAISESIAQAQDKLPCRPINDDIDISFIPDPGHEVEVISNFETGEILFPDLPKGTKINFKFQCEDNSSF